VLSSGHLLDNRYRLDERIATGGMGDVWRGTDIVLGRVIAVKVLRPAMLADPSFNRQNPILDSVGLDDKFDPAKPEVLQYDGNGPTAKLVGFDYYVRTSTGKPPAGFAGKEREE